MRHRLHLIGFCLGVMALVACTQTPPQEPHPLAQTQPITPTDPLALAMQARENHDHDTAFSLLHPLAEAGNPQAQQELGDAYYYGLGVEMDYPTAFEWWHKAADQGPPEAQHNLGFMYRHRSEHGTIPEYEAIALTWYQKAAAQGYAPAQSYMGVIYAQGLLGIEASNAIAAEWWHKAAAQGITYAQYHLAEAYFYGLGVEQDYPTAAHWYRAAAHQGHVFAQYYLAEAYEYGRGVAQDYQIARAWFNVAFINGFDWYPGLHTTAKLRAIAKHHLSREALVESRRLAHQCVDSGYQDCP